MDLILTGRPVTALEALDFGLANRLVDPGTARAVAEALAAEIAAFPQVCMRNDRHSVLEYGGLSEYDAMQFEIRVGIDSLAADGLSGAGRFSAGAGRHGEFGSTGH